MSNQTKYKELVTLLQSMESVVVAFSGGVDSSFLLKVAKEALGDKVKAVTIQSPYIPRWEIAEAKELVQELGVNFEILEAPIIDEIRHNPENRCYLCKKAVFSQIKAIAARDGYRYVIDGTNFDDQGDYRPGLQALKELDIKSPLFTCQLTKQEIRDFSQELGLSTWDKPPYACLLTRLPYGTELKEEDFRKIERAERYMMQLGFRAIRVRCHGDLARIEVDNKDKGRLLQQELLATISAELKSYGFLYVTLDLDGYQMGSFNAAIQRQA